MCCALLKLSPNVHTHTHSYRCHTNNNGTQPISHLFEHICINSILTNTKPTIQRHNTQRIRTTQHRTQAKMKRKNGKIKIRRRQRDTMNLNQFENSNKINAKQIFSTNERARVSHHCHNNTKILELARDSCAY